MTDGEQAQVQQVLEDFLQRFHQLITEKQRADLTLLLRWDQTTGALRLKKVILIRD